MNTFGPLSYSEAVSKSAEWIHAEKEEKFPDKLMLLGLEGLTNAGKSTFSSRLEEELRGHGIECLYLEGDGFHQGWRKAAEVYKEVISMVEAGRTVPEDFTQRIWREKRETRNSD